MGTLVRFLIEVCAVFLIYYAFKDNVDYKIHSKGWWKQLAILAIAITIIKLNHDFNLI
tara:strand:+ start:247 stop:420 length:174 start_codon:yes stop_codon:yes gene_type:complete